MEYRKLGGSDLSLPAVSFGAWAIGGWMWGGTDDELAIRAIQHGVDVGITCIDTAPGYGFGHSEEIVGKAIAGRRDQVVIATKCGLRWDCTDGEFFFEVRNGDEARPIYRNLRPGSVRYETEQSLRRLRVDTIDLMQCHWPDPTTNIDDTMDILLTLQKEGKIRAFGVSNFTPAMMSQCLTKAPIASNQPKYSLLSRGVEQEVLPFCRDHHIGILAYSPIEQGLLSGKVTQDTVYDPDDARNRNPWFSMKNRGRVASMLEKIRPIAREHEATLAQIAAAWVIHQPGVTTALVGARNEKQVLENAKAGEIKLSAAEIAAIRDYAEALGEPEA